MSDFMRTLCKIAIPVTLQGMLQASFSIVDQIMIGQLGEAGIAAVGLCSNFTLIFSVMSGAVGTVAGILIAQFLGAEEHTEAWRSLDVSLVCGGVCGPRSRAVPAYRFCRCDGGSTVSADGRGLPGAGLGTLYGR